MIQGDDSKWSEAKQVTCEQLAAQLTEFFQSYVLVGFTLAGERVKVKHVIQDIHEDALQQLLEDTVVRDFKINDRVTAFEPPEEEDGAQT